jgi:hypothetical protein
MSQHKKRFDNYSRDIGINQKPQKASQTDRSKKTRQHNLQCKTQCRPQNPDKKAQTKQKKTTTPLVCIFSHSNADCTGQGRFFIWS